MDDSPVRDADPDAWLAPATDPVTVTVLDVAGIAGDLAHVAVHGMNMSLLIPVAHIRDATGIQPEDMRGRKFAADLEIAPDRASLVRFRHDVE